MAEDGFLIAGALTEEGHRLTQRVYYEDTDFSGLVYHARYLHFLERGRTDYLRCLGVEQRELITADEEGCTPVISESIRIVMAVRLVAPVDPISVPVAVAVSIMISSLICETLPVIPNSRPPSSNAIAAVILDGNPVCPTSVASPVEVLMV